MNLGAYRPQIFHKQGEEKGITSMALLRKKFDPMNAYRSHEGTILASDVTPEGFSVPFQHAYGYLLNSGAMAGHAHPTDEIYLVLSGSGYVILGGGNRGVSAGDVVAIPPNTWHTMLCTEKDDAPFLWAALWWEHLDGAKKDWKPEDGIPVLRFSKETATPSHNGTILASEVVPDVLNCPFGHAYGYLEDGNSMENHAHETKEFYVFFEGTGTMTVGEETEPVGPGDVVAIPSGMPHSVTAQKGEKLLFAAFWWAE